MAEPSDPVARNPAPVAPAELPGLNALFTLLVAVVVIAALYLAREVLIPITLAVLLSFLLAPVVRLLHWLRLGRVPAVLIAVALGVAMILAIAGLIGTQIADLVAKVPDYTYTIQHKIEAVQNFTFGHLSTLVNGLSHEAAAPAASHAPAQTPAPGPTPIPVQVQTPLSAVAVAESVLAPIVSPLATTGIVFVVSIFIQLQQEDLRDRFIRLIGSGDLHRTTVAMDDAAHRLSRYFLAQLSVNAGFGCVIGFGLALIGVPSPVLWGVMAMLLRFVPYIGAPMAAVLPIALAAAVNPGWGMAVWTAALFLAVELVTGQAVEPMLYGHSTGLSPVAVIVAAIFWTWIWGPIGLILSTPMTLCLVVLGQHVKRLEFLDVLLGDRPALTAVESFYQRMLAGDPDEAEEQAQEILKERSLTAYYDEVAVRGLQLATGDALRGVLTTGQVNRLRGAVDDLVRELDEHVDATVEARDPGPRLPRFLAGHIEAPDALPELAPAWESETPLLCVAGRGPLDEAASMMLAQLLSKHGLNARVLPHASVSRTRIAGLRVDGVAMVCLTYLEITGSPAHLRNLLRRLRQRLPDQTILVGLWPSDDPMLGDERLRAAAGADFYVTSFREAVEACLEMAHTGGAPRRRTAA
jgi:predicted PurR-regulated permease PerM